MSQIIKHIIFDFDGTIVDSRYLIVELLNELSGKYKFPIIREKDLEALRKLPLLEKFKAIQIPPLQLPLLAAELLIKYRQSISTLQISKNIQELIWKLKEKGFRLSIISSNSADIIADFLRNNNISVFDSIYSSYGVFGKDQAIRGFLGKYNLKKGDAIYIGDEQRDILACKKSGLKIIAVTWGYDSVELLAGAGPDYLVDNPREILDLPIF